MDFWALYLYLVNRLHLIMITLQTAQFSDYLSIAHLHAANWRQSYRGILSDFFLENEVEKYMEQTWRYKLDKPPAKQFTTLALYEHKIVGFSCLVLDEDPRFGSMLDNLHVAPGEQNKGIGKTLMQHCAGIIIDLAKDRSLWLWVYAQNLPAIAVYERLGGTRVETVEKQTAEDRPALVHRYAWADVSLLR